MQRREFHIVVYRSCEIILEAFLVFLFLLAALETIYPGYVSLFLPTFALLVVAFALMVIRNIARFNTRELSVTPRKGGLSATRIVGLVGLALIAGGMVYLYIHTVWQTMATMFFGLSFLFVLFLGFLLFLEREHEEGGTTFVPPSNRQQRS